MSVWEKPSTVPAVSRNLARRYKATSGDPAFLTIHPSPESLVVQASCSRRQGSGAFPTTPADRESKKHEQVAKKVFSSGSMALKSLNVVCILGRYAHALWESAQALMVHLPEEAKPDFRELVVGGQCAAQQIIQAGPDTADSVARSMATSVAMRRQAWLRGSGFSQDVQNTFQDLPFDVVSLF